MIPGHRSFVVDVRATHLSGSSFLRVSIDDAPVYIGPNTVNGRAAATEALGAFLTQATAELLDELCPNQATAKDKAHPMTDRPRTRLRECDKHADMGAPPEVLAHLFAMAAKECTFRAQDFCSRIENNRIARRLEKRLARVRSELEAIDREHDAEARRERALAGAYDDDQPERPVPPRPR